MLSALKSPFRSVAAAIGLLLFSSLSMHAQVSRIAQSVPSASPRVTLTNSVSPRARAAMDLGAAPADRMLTSVTVRFNMTDAQTKALDALIAAQQNPSSPLYRHWLTPEQYAAKFGLSTADVVKVTSWLQSQGLTVTSVARGHGFVTVSGTVSQLQTAFGTSIHNITLNGEQHIANVSDISLPSPIAAVTSTVTGLNDIRLKPRAHPHYTSSATGDHFIAPGDFYTIYDINPLLAAGNAINGSGVTIAVAGQTDISLTDIAAFRSASGLSVNPPTVKLVGTTDPGVPSADDQIEASVDVEWSGAVAPSASILYVNGKDVIGDSLTQIIDQNLAPIATVSYGNCESMFGTASDLASYSQLFRQGTVQGQTILGPAGDSGATDCDNKTDIATGGLAVDFPASSPYVLGIGGTMFDDTTGTYWSTTNGATQGSALSYIPEEVWNETADGNGLSSGGGGKSAYFTKPAWQIGTGVPADSSRDVPDLAFNAASEHDGYLFCQGGACSNGYRNSGGYLDVVGGTSVSTPAMAGIMALLEQSIRARVGLANPTIYALANSTYASTVFHDVTAGSNDSPCTLGTTNCTVVVDPCAGASNTGNGCIGYNATTGYDLASGWGSLDVLNFVTDFSLVTPLGSGTNGTDTSSTTVTASATSLTTGTALTLTATVASATTGVTTTPTGTAQLTLDGSNTGSVVSLSSGKATFTYDTTNLSSGSHVFGVAYSGDATFDGSKGTASVDVTSATAADFTLSPSTATATTTSGGTAPGITLTVAPTSGFTGAVTFTASTSSSTLDASYAFSVNPVTISGTTGATTVFTLTAAESDAKGAVGLHRLGGRNAVNQTPGKPGRWAVPVSGIALAGLLCFVLPKRRNCWVGLILALVSAGVLGASGCGSGSRTASTITTTASGTYTIVVTASGTNAAGTALSHNATVTFVVQ